VPTRGGDEGVQSVIEAIADTPILKSELHNGANGRGFGASGGGVGIDLFSTPVASPLGKLKVP
jgi:hypothetical protein